MEDMQNSLRDTFAKTLLIAFVIIFLLFIWSQRYVVLLFFAGTLMAILFTIPIEKLKRHTRLSHTLSFFIVLFSIIAILALSLGFLIPMIGEQIQKIKEVIPQATDELMRQIRSTEWGEDFLNRWSAKNFLEDNATKIGGFFVSAFDFLFAAGVILFIGIFLAFNHFHYKEPFLQLLPKKKRAKANNVLEKIATQLRRWLLTRLLSMLAIALLTIIGLYIVKLPLAVPLGILAGVLTFIPYLGPILSAVPAILLAFVQSPTTALYTIIVFIIVQIIESNLITPMLEQRIVRLPPAFAIVFQISMGIMFGLLGIALASPILLTVIVMVQELYVKQHRNERVK